MIVYLVATILTCWLAWVASLCKKPSERIRWAVASALPLTIISAIRWDVGTDFYWTYFPAYQTMECINAGGTDALVQQYVAPLFERLKNGSIDSVAKLYEYYTMTLCNQEWGFRKLMEFSSWSGLGFRNIIVTTSLLINACVFTAIWRQSKAPVLASFLYIATSNFFLGLNIIRQFVAIGFMLIAIEFIVRRKLWAFALCIACGMLFHYTVALVVPCYFLCRIALKPRWCFALVALALGASFIAEPVALTLMPKIGLAHYCRYFGTDSPWAQEGFEYMLFAINMAFLVFGGWYWKRAKEQSPYFLIWYNMTLIGTLFLALSGTVPLMKRMNYYFAAPQFLLLPEILLAEARPQVRAWLTRLVVVAFALECLVAVWVFNKNEVLPYLIKCNPKHEWPRVKFATKPFGWKLENAPAATNLAK